MKKLIPALLFAALFMMFAACGDDKKDEPVEPVVQQIESEHGVTNDTYLIWDIDMSQDSSSIFVYNVKFAEQMPININVRVDAPCTVDKTGKVFTFIGTNIMPYLLMGSTPTPFPTLRINDLKSVVNTENKTYSISFVCQGTVTGKSINGDYKKEGNIK